MDSKSTTALAAARLRPASTTRTAQARPGKAASRRESDIDVPPPSGRQRSAARRHLGAGRATTAEACPAPQKARHSSHVRRRTRARRVQLPRRLRQPAIGNPKLVGYSRCLERFDSQPARSIQPSQSVDHTGTHPTSAVKDQKRRAFSNSISVFPPTSVADDS
jgi:hypothetical protein